MRLAVLCAFAMAASGRAEAYTYTPLETEMAWGLARLNGALFVVDCRNARLLRVDEARRVAKSMSTSFDGAASSPRGLCAVGSSLAYADGASRKIVFVDPREMRRVRDIPAPGPTPQGLAFDGEAIWCADLDADRLYWLDPSSGRVLAEFPTPSYTSRGMTFARGDEASRPKLWVLDSWDMCAYRLTPETGEVEASVAVLPGRPRGILVEGRSLLLSLAARNALVDIAYEERDGYTLSLPIEAHVELRCEVRTRDGKGAPSGAKAVVALPAETPRQSIDDLRCFPGAAKRRTDAYGQTVAVWDVPPLKPGETFGCGWEADVRVLAMRLSPLPRESAGREDVDPAYLRSDSHINGDAATLRGLTDGLQNVPPLEALLGLRNRIFQRMTYKLEGGWDPAEVVLRRGSGSCSEYSFVFASAARSMGVPVRLAGGTCLRASEDKERPTLERVDKPSHRWPEAYIEGYGWVPVDANRDDNAKGPPFRRRYFLALPSGVVVCSRGPLGEGSAMGRNYRARLLTPKGRNRWNRGVRGVWRLKELTPWTM